MGRFYTDGLGRRRPITSRKFKGEKVGKNCLSKQFRIGPNNDFKAKLSIAKSFLDLVLTQIPFVRELWAVYTVADSIYQNWTLIKEQYNKLKEGKTIETKIVIEEVAVSPILASVQASAVLSVIGQVMPKELNDAAKTIVSNLFNEITDEEIDYVNRFL